MAVLSQETQKTYDAQVASINHCANYYFNNKGEVTGFDSVATVPNERPAVLQDIFDSIDSQYHSKIDAAVRMGVSAYQARNGGELPDASLIASALYAGAEVAKSDGKAFAGFDDISNGAYEQAAVVPAMTVVTIANVIASALPMVAMLPNPTSSARVPVVAVRYTTDSTFAGMEKGDYLDGEGAGKPYAEGRFRFALVAGENKSYSVTARTAYADFKAKTPDANAPLLPFLAGNVSVRINGKEVAHSRGDRNLGVQSGTIALTATNRKAIIGGAEYKVVDSAVNLDTKAISVTLNNALPEGAVIEVYLVADFDAKDANKNHILNPVGVSLAPEYDEIQSVPFVNQITVSFNVQNQIANELGFGFIGSALASMQGKVFLEQNIRLLSEGKERAVYNGRNQTFDVSRGATGNLTAAYNTTGDLIGEVFKFINLAMVQIRQATGGSTVKFDLFVGDKGAVFFSQLPAEKFKSTGLTASYGEIVRIGTLSNGVDVYHSPTAQGVLDETATTAELMLVGRGAEPARNPFVGSITQAPTIREAHKDTREAQFGLHGQMAAELNPIDRYADQVAVITMTNLASIG
ncbi:hypothetical protein F965_00491 [Acinetobacter schindleri NIPH 900]|uniref:Uncharacterized protein n=1 Tax=Acinetobacter schindleri NIPH 900 TaxID=1217675 RepID=N8Y3M8_9GAMM|nr:hypothetical protein [Acinetobacter schindleri]ENV14248.1 hypothetical protein F965_00491 [Acinetobacter schindleri NIPH 900]